MIEFQASYELTSEGWRDVALRPDPAVFRSSIMEVQEQLAQMPQVETPVRHYFAHGMYAREMFIPAGTLLIGKIHRFENISVLSQGEIIVFTEEGTQRVKAPYTVVSPPGTKRAGYAVTDVIWTTFHPTNSRDLAEIEAEVIAPDYDDPALVAFADAAGLLEHVSAKVG